MSDDTPPPAEPAPAGSRLDQPVAFLSSDHGLLVRKVLRIGVTGVVCLLAWLYVAYLAFLGLTESDGYLLVMVLFSLPVAVGLTVVGIAAIRSPRVRRAVAPFEMAAWIGIAVWLVTIVLPDGDPYSGQEFLAAGYAVVCALVLTFVVLVTRGWARERTWYFGAVGVLLTVGVLLVPVQHALDDVATIDPEFGPTSTVLAGSFGADGAFSLTPRTSPFSSTLDAGYEPSASQGGIDDTMTYGAAGGAVGVVQSGVPGGVIESFGDVALRALPSDALRLDVRPSVAADDQRLLGVVRRGTCAAPGAVVGAPIALRSGRPTRSMLPLTLPELDSTTTLVLVAGTGAQLAPVRCMSLVDPVALRTAKLGAARFGVRCIAPLHLAVDAQSTLTAASFQDPSCAQDWVRLDQVASSQLVPADRVESVRACIAGSDVAGSLQVLDDGTGLLQVSAYSDQAVAQCAALNDPIPAAPAVAIPAPAEPLADPALATDLDGQSPAEVRDKLQ